jgi:hypothetical protein
MGKFLNLLYDNDLLREYYIDLMNNYKIDDYILCKLNSIKDKPNEKFYYIYKTNAYLEPLFKNTNGLPITDEMKSMLREYENFHFIILNEHESDGENVLNVLEIALRLDNLNPKQFHFLCNNVKLEELKEFTGSDVNVHRVDWASVVSVKEMSKYDHPFIGNKEFLFMTHNRMVKSHRIALLCLLRKYNLLDKVDWSFIRGNELKNNFFGSDGNIVPWLLNNIFTQEEIIDLKEDIDYFKNYGIKKSVFETIEEFDFPPHLLERSITFRMNSYGHSYINIVTETHFEPSYIMQPSEKSFLPFNFLQLPLFVATKDHVKKMRELYGFDFFDDIINHSYDEEPDNGKRMKMIIDEIIRLDNIRDEIIDFYRTNENRFMKNREINLLVMNNEKDTNYFKNLI